MSRTESMRLNFRVPGVYLTWAYVVFLSFFSFNRISNLRVFTTAFSSIPTAPTNLILNLYFKPMFLCQLNGWECVPSLHVAPAG